MDFRFRLKSVVVAFAFSLFALFLSSASRAAVSPGQEQNRFEAGVKSKQAAETVSEEEKPASVQFASSEESAENENEETAPADEEETTPASTTKKIVLPIQGRISVAQLRALADSVKDIEDENGEVEVSLSIEIAKKPGVLHGKKSVSHVSEEFENPLPPAGYNPKEQRALKAAERKAAADAAQQASGPAVTPIAENVPFTVQHIKVTGNTVVKDAEIRPIVAPYEGRQLKLADAKQAAEKITELYRSKGYLTCRAYIPPQDVAATKTLEIKIFEGKLGKIKVRGNKFFNRAVIKRYVNQLKDKVLQFDSLKSSLQRLNMHPDREVKAVVVPGQEVGTSDLLLDVKDQMPLHIGGEINDFGTKNTGLERYNVTARHDNLLGVDDVFATRIQFGDQVFALGMQHVLPVGPYGTQAGWTFNYTDVNVGGAFTALDIGGTAYTGSVFVNQPIYDSRNVDLTWTGSLESKSIYNTVLNTASSEDQLRLVHTGINIDETDRYGRTFITNDLEFGTPWFGASQKDDPRLSRADAGAGFFKYDAALNRIHPIYNETYLYMKGSAQISPDRLLSSEQYDIGGVYSVRGYPQSDYLGDQGVGGSLELRVPWYFIPKYYKVPYTDEPIWDKIHFVGFLDGAYANLRSTAVGEDASKSYIGIGLGLRFDLPNNFTGRFEWGSPIGDKPTDGSNGQFYFSISGDFV